MDSEAYRYKKSLSDISGNDISSHDNSPEKVTGQIRNWVQIHREPSQPVLLSGSKIWILYNEFVGNLQTLITTKADIDGMPSVMSIANCRVKPL